MQERHGATGRTRQAAFAAVGFVSLLLAVLLGWLSLQGEGGCSGDNDAAALRHERETLLARQLEQFSCIRQARVQLAPQSWQSGAVIVLEPARPEAMPDAAALDRMLDTLALIPDAPDKRHVLVFDTEGRRLYPDHETDETARREQEVALERQALRVLRPLLEGNGRAEVLVSLDGAEKGRTTGRRTISVLLEENAVPETVRPYLESLLGQACALEEGRGDALRPSPLPCWLWPVWLHSFGHVVGPLAHLPIPKSVLRKNCRVRQKGTAKRQRMPRVCAGSWKPLCASIPGRGWPCCGTG